MKPFLSLQGCQWVTTDENKREKKREEKRKTLLKSVCLAESQICKSVYIQEKESLVESW